jgi:hypothetical protein
MPHFTTDHVFILPHAEEYRALYSIPRKQVLATLNHPDTREGLTTGRYTAEKTLGTHRVYVYYYRTLPRNGKTDEVYAIVDFIGYAEASNELLLTQQRKDEKRSEPL